MKDEKLIIRDSDSLKNIFIQMDIKKGRISVLSGFSSWENLAIIMEALAVTAEKCIDEGIEKKQVYDEIKKYMTQVLGAYQILKTKSGEVQ
ncbi:MAG: hypothetical protein UT32_C0043G0005 [Parcubacteria group bacterium GW2011_GWC2_39_14]|nr:MAG: hypothetical protein UT32_C0043G0005 [Parcubacteria group bacterium GW2011_GWC2_39_14]